MSNKAYPGVVEQYENLSSEEYVKIVQKIYLQELADYNDVETGLAAGGYSTTTLHEVVLPQQRHREERLEKYVRAIINRLSKENPNIFSGLTVEEFSDLGFGGYENYVRVHKGEPKPEGNAERELYTYAEQIVQALRRGDPV